MSECRKYSYYADVCEKHGKEFLYCEVEISRLREALDRYGRHEPECHYECCDVFCASPKCTCGLDKAKGEP